MISYITKSLCYLWSLLKMLQTRGADVVSVQTTGSFWHLWSKDGWEKAKFNIYERRCLTINNLSKVGSAQHYFFCQILQTELKCGMWRGPYHRNYTHRNISTLFTPFSSCLIQNEANHVCFKLKVYLRVMSKLNRHNFCYVDIIRNVENKCSPL